MSWFLMNKKGEERKRRDEIKKQFMKALGKEATDGKLSRDQWQTVMAAAGIHNSVEEVQKMFDNKDKDLDGRLSFEEFMGEESRAERLFKLMDKDGDGFVTKTEFREVCKNLNKEQIDIAFKKFDQTGNAKLNFREFCDMMNKRTPAAGSKPANPNHAANKSANNVTDPKNPSAAPVSPVAAGHKLLTEQPTPAAPASSPAHKPALVEQKSLSAVGSSPVHKPTLRTQKSLAAAELPTVNAPLAETE